METRSVIWAGKGQSCSVIWVSVVSAAGRRPARSLCLSRGHSEASIPDGIRRVCRDELLGKSGQVPFPLYQGTLLLAEEREMALIFFLLQNLLKSDCLC